MTILHAPIKGFLCDTCRRPIPLGQLRYGVCKDCLIAALAELDLPDLTPALAAVYQVLTFDWQTTREVVLALYGPEAYEGNSSLETHRVQRRVFKQLQRLWRLRLLQKTKGMRLLRYDNNREWMRETSLWRLKSHD